MRELHEEAEVQPTGPLQLHGVFSNHSKFPGDHLVVYTLREFSWNGFTPTSEIVSAEFFAPEQLPAFIVAEDHPDLFGDFGQYLYRVAHLLKPSRARRMDSSTLWGLLSPLR